MQHKPLKTFDDVRNDFRRRGISVADWAKEHGFDAKLVYAVLQGDRKCYRGKSHRIAVTLGVKDDI